MISTRARYALRVLIDLAQNQETRFIPLKEISKRQEISEKYLEIIVKTLVKGNILKGLRGKGGGYRLTRLPEEYTIGEIIELTEGPIAPVACLLPDAEICRRKSDCITLPLWEKFDSLIHDFFYSITLDDLINGRLSQENIECRENHAGKPLKEKKDGHAPSSAGDTSGDREAEIP